MVANCTAVTIYDDATTANGNLASRNGTLVPDRIIKGSNTQLSSPHGLFLLEQ